jgi:hypothetical protein
MLSALTQPNYPKAAIGIEMDKLTMLEVQKEGRGQFTLKQASSIEVPAGLIVPSFLERNIRNSTEFLYLLEEAATISGLMNQKRWSVALPSNTGRSAILTLDSEPASKQELEEILDWKTEHSFGAPAADLRISRERISPDRDGKARYFATAVKLIVIDEFETAFESMGWNAGLILPRTVSESSWLYNRKSFGDSLLLSAQNDGFTALLLRGGEPRVVRSVICGPAEIDDEIYRLLMFYKRQVRDRGCRRCAGWSAVGRQSLCSSKGRRNFKKKLLGGRSAYFGPMTWECKCLPAVLALTISAGSGRPCISRRASVVRKTYL